MAQRPTTSRPSARAVSYLPLVVFIAGYLAINLVWPLPVWVTVLYVTASILCFIAYARDKAAAAAGRWRIPETTLLLLGLIGGWPGAIVAQQLLRHKTRKARFLSAFWLTVMANVPVLIVFGTPLGAALIGWGKAL